MSEPEARRVVIITGANSGIGFGSARLLAREGYEVVIGCRSEERAQEALNEIKREFPEAAVSYHQLDLADTKSIDSFAEWFLSTEKPLYALVNNAGVLRSTGPRETTKDGFEQTFGVNHLGHFLLTMELLDRLKESSRKYGQARIVNVSSDWHKAERMDNRRWPKEQIQPIDLDDLNLEKPGAYNWGQAYKNSKAANVLFTNALSRSLEGTGVVAHSMCPGLIPQTGIFRDSGFLIRSMMSALNLWSRLFGTEGIVKNVDYGSRHIVNLVHEKEFGLSSGIYYKDFKETETSPEAKDVALQNQLWLKSCQMLGRQYEDILKQ